MMDHDTEDFLHGLFEPEKTAEDYSDLTLAELEACLGIEVFCKQADVDYQGNPNNGDPAPRGWPEAALGVESAGRRATPEEQSAQDRTATPQHVEPSTVGDRSKQAVSNSWITKRMVSGGLNASGDRLHDMGWRSAVKAHSLRNPDAIGKRMTVIGNAAALKTLADPQTSDHAKTRLLKSLTGGMATKTSGDLLKQANVGFMIPVHTRRATPYGEELAKGVYAKMTPEERRETHKHMTTRHGALGAALGGTLGLGMSAHANKSLGGGLKGMALGAGFGALGGAALGALRKSRGVETGELPRGENLSVLDEIDRRRARTMMAAPAADASIAKLMGRGESKTSGLATEVGDKVLGKALHSGALEYGPVRAGLRGLQSVGQRLGGKNTEQAVGRGILATGAAGLAGVAAAPKVLGGVAAAKKVKEGSVHLSDAEASAALKKVKHLALLSGGLGAVGGSGLTHAYHSLKNKKTKVAFQPGQLLKGGLTQAVGGGAARSGWASALKQQASHVPAPAAGGGQSLRSILKRQAAEKAAPAGHSAALFSDMVKTQSLKISAMRPQDLASHLAKLKSQTATARAAATGAASGVRRIAPAALAEAPHIATQKARYLARSGGGPLSTIAGVA